MKKNLVLLIFISFLVSATFVSATPNLDVNRDTRVDWIDWLVTCAVATGFSPVYVPEADVDGNGVVDLFDLQLINLNPEKDLLPHDLDFLYLFKTKRFLGDLNNDGIVNVVDGTLLSKEIYSSNPDNKFDLNRDGKTNEIDLKEIWTPRFGVKYYDIKTAKPAESASISVEEIKKMMAPFGIETAFAVKSYGKLAKTWGSIKSGGGR